MKSIKLWLITAFLLAIIFLLKLTGMEINLVDKTLAAIIGSLVIALALYELNSNNERMKNYRYLYNSALTIFSEKTSLYNDDNNNWIQFEFRRAVGMARWSEDPENHLQLQIDLSDQKYVQIKWDGVVYKVDERFCVASKSLHELSNWIRMVIEGYNDGILDDKLLRMLWRSLVDVLYENYDNSQRVGMRRWTLFFLYGRVGDFNKDRKYKPTRVIIKVLDNMDGVKVYKDQDKLVS